MSVNESTVGDAALGWFGELGYAVRHEQLASVTCKFDLGER
jgi:hypothetical protein